MTKHPFAVPARLSANLVRARAYWRGLLRGGATIPFWDDLDPRNLGELQSRMVLIDVFERPQRFRVNACGAGLGVGALAGAFIDEIDLAAPLDYLRAQCSATVEAGAPTFFQSEGGKKGPYVRLMLPLWGEGRIGMLLGVVDFA